ncbi:hydroxymethylpyrimidine kinase [Glaciecola punicea ACAM 611]|uniref:hydroxymethylpyrimidine kinase n=1 Tax=Glaciecola punicea ACAM 611 TaxID=1121923 RepID=H5TCP9_9ALTE|nr:bifunctional hydroxymethylpyrimidine kinase/phosphomethylpyrimidine kinase [Glaciecola punicea]GAB56076.1 hydroxymethylpyrimidine kinase [Glaciecola punicea ACAM 611]
MSNQHKIFARTQPAKPIVWSIAGSDSGGGAGIQADSLTIHDLGGHACNVVTAITAQNSHQVIDVAPTCAMVLLNQLNGLLDDLPPSAIKIGVLANAEQFQLISHWLSNTLRPYQQQHDLLIPVIWDPVMVSTSGQSLTLANNSPTVDDYISLANHVTLITPNAFELQVLARLLQAQGNTSQEPLECLANAVLSGVLVTGGADIDTFAIDWLMAKSIAHTSVFHAHQRIGFQSSRVDTRHNHGTGCALSAAIATAMAFGHPLLDATVIAKAYVHQGLSSGYGLGKGAGVLGRNGWPHDLVHFPEILMPHYASLSINHGLVFAKVIQPLGVYTVTKSVSVLEQVLKSGARTVQLRIKNNSVDKRPLNEIEKDIIQAISLGHKYKAQVFINDHWEIALKHGAFGVHLGQEDVLQANLLQIANAGLASGLSSHGYFEMLLAQQLNPSYLAIGHIFSTPTKQMPSKPQGLLKLSCYCKLLKNKMPLVAIGGVDLQNLAQLKATAVHDVAVVRGIESTENPGQSWQALQQKWQALT